VTCDKTGSQSTCRRCNQAPGLASECTACHPGFFVHNKVCIALPQCKENSGITTEFGLDEAGAHHAGCENSGGKLINKHGKDWGSKTRYNRGDNSWNWAEDHDTCVFTSAAKPLNFNSGAPVHGFKKIKVQFVLETPYDNLEQDETSVVELRTCTSSAATSCSQWFKAHDAVLQGQRKKTYTAEIGTNELDSIGAQVWVGGSQHFKDWTTSQYNGLKYTHGHVQTRVTLSLNNQKEITRKIVTDIHSCRVHTHTSCHRCGRSGRSRCCNHHYANRECSNQIDQKVFQIEEQSLSQLKVWGSC
jgi:hypothetical protein